MHELSFRWVPRCYEGWYPIALGFTLKEELDPQSYLSELCLRLPQYTRGYAVHEAQALVMAYAKLSPDTLVRQKQKSKHSTQQKKRARTQCKMRTMKKCTKTKEQKNDSRKTTRKRTTVLVILHPPTHPPGNYCCLCLSNTKWSPGP